MSSTTKELLVLGAKLVGAGIVIGICISLIIY